MAEYTVDKIEYGGNIYKLQDNESGFVTTEVFYGTCATGASTAAKVVTCETFTSSDLKPGVIIIVNFSATNSAAVGDLTLNVNSTGAKKIQYINNGTRGNLSDVAYLKASTSYPFIYDGTYWLAQINYNSNTTYSAGTAALIEEGTNTSNRVWQAKILHDYITAVAGNGAFIGTESTTFNEFKSAIEAGKAVFLEIEDDDDAYFLYPLTYYDLSETQYRRLEFTGYSQVNSSTVTVGRKTLDGNGTWGTSSVAAAPKASPALTGTPTAPTATAGTNTTQIATTAFVKTAVDNGALPKTTTTPKMDGTAAIGSETKYAAGDHVHPSDTSRVPRTMKINGMELTTDRNIVTQGSAIATGGNIMAAYYGTEIYNFYDSAAVDGLLIYANTQIAQTYVAKTTTVNGKALSSNVTLTGDDIKATPPSSADNSTIYDWLTSLYSNKAPLTSPALTGTPTAPTATAGTNTTQIATTAFVKTAIDNAGITDEKVATEAVTSGTTYYPVVGSDTTTATKKNYDKTGLVYKGTNGTTSAVGGAELTLGNSTASGTANNKQGKINLYGSTAYATTLVSGAPTAARTITLPNATGTLALNTVVSQGSSTTSGGLMSQADKTRLDGIPEHVELTQAEYDALSTAEKNNGTVYFITDSGSLEYGSVFVKEAKQFQLTYTSTSNPYANGIFDITKAGYTPIAVCHWVIGEGSSAVFCSCCCLDGNTVRVTARSTVTPTSTTANSIILNITYVRSDYV